MLATVAAATIAPPDPVAIFGAPNIIWFNTYDATKYTLASGKYSALADNGTLRSLTLEQTTAGKQPIQSHARGTNCGLMLAGSQTYLQSSATYAALTAGVGYTIIQLMRPMSFGTGTVVNMSGGAGTMSTQTINSRDLRINAGANQTASNAFEPGELCAIEASILTGANSNAYKYGAAGITQLLTNVNAGANSITDLFWGANASGASNMSGDLGELIIVNRVITPTERAAVAAWLDYKWHITEAQRTIMFISDSNFLANGSADGITTVRSLLWDTFKQSKVNGYWIHPIGNLVGGAYSGNWHQGTVSIGVDALTTQLATLWSGGFFTPHIVYLLDGNADARNLAPASYVPEPDASSTLDRYEAMVSAIGAAGAGTVAIRCMSLKNFPPGDPTRDANVADFCSGLPGRITTLQGTYPQVGECDLNTLMPYDAAYYGSGGADEHWNEAGKDVVRGIIAADLATIT